MPRHQRPVRESLVAQATVLAELVAAALESTLRENGMNFGTFELLSAVHRSGGKGSQASIARALGITPPSLCEAVRSAQAKGLIRQVPSEKDLRTKHLELTERGERGLAQAVARLAEIENRLPPASRQAT
jgi:DNA-binding MarR family transcriptional regulator